MELSERARRRVEELVEDGSFPTPEAVVEAALEQLDLREVSSEEIMAAAARGRADFAAGRFRSSEAVAATMRARMAERFPDSRE